MLGALHGAFRARVPTDLPQPGVVPGHQPDAGDERVRKQNKQPYYSDEEMFQALDSIQGSGISVDVFFSLALPGRRSRARRRRPT